MIPSWSFGIRLVLKLDHTNHDTVLVQFQPFCGSYQGVNADIGRPLIANFALGVGGYEIDARYLNIHNFEVWVQSENL